jgi:hypothetical protein
MNYEFMSSFNPKTFLHETYRNCLSPSFYYQFLFDDIPLDDLCMAFFKTCPFLISLPWIKGWEPELIEWCTINTNGYWMYNHFPKHIWVTMNSRNLWSFQDKDDAMLFKLTFC